MFIFAVQLTTSRIGNLTRLIYTLLYLMTIQIYRYTDRHGFRVEIGNWSCGKQSKTDIVFELTRRDVTAVQQGSPVQVVGQITVQRWLGTNRHGE